MLGYAVSKGATTEQSVACGPTQVFHHGQREDDPHSHNDDQVVSVHEPVTAGTMETHSKMHHATTSLIQTSLVLQA